MSAKNDITGDAMKSRILSKEGRDNWDNIFGKKTAYEWLKELYPDKSLEILDPDGWRKDDGVTLETKITKEDFHYRLSLSTVSCIRELFNEKTVEHLG